MAVQTEVWVRDIQEVLFAGPNEFLRASVNHDAFVVNKTVHVPQAGSLPAVTKNRTVFPAPVVNRDDTTLDYDLDAFSVDPVRIGRIEEVQISYQKRQSVMAQHMNKLNDLIAKEGIFNWATDTGTNQVRTTGTDSSLNLPVGATGTRKKTQLEDLATVAQTMDDQDVPDDGRWLMLPSKMYYELFTIQDLIRDDIIGETTLPDAAIRKILNFNIMKRSSNTVVKYNDDATPLRKAVGAAATADANFGAIAWHIDAVATALGEIAVFADEGAATMYGDVISADVLSKTTKLRSDEAGIVTLIQAA